MLTSLKFLVDDPIFEHEQPYELFGAVLKPGVNPSQKLTNCSYHVQTGVTINDVRDCGSDVRLDEQGFTFVKHRTSCPLSAQHFEATGKDPDNQVVLSYLYETIALVERQLRPEKVICIDWRFRRSSPPAEAPETISTSEVLEARSQALLPGLLMHCDFSHQGGRDRLEIHLTQDELDMVDSGKWQAEIINAWRPFETVRIAPLVVADRRSVLCDDLVECHKVMPDRVVKNFYLKHRPHHQWYFLADQTPNDVAFFKTWTSTRGRDFADYSPHGAAMYFPEGYHRPRESIEVRMIVLRANV